MKKIILLIWCVIFTSSFVSADTAAEIVLRTRTKSGVDSVGTRSKLEIQNAGTTINVLIIDQYSSKDKDGLQRTLIDFKEPANARGTRFLMLERKGGSMDQRIFLPNLGKTRRIAAESEGNESFMGTDFSYNDISFLDRDTGLDTFSIVKEEVYNGKSCYVIEAVPKDKNYSYSKTIMWIEKEADIFHKGEFYDKNFKLEKIIELSNYKAVNGIMTPHTTKLSTLKTNTSTVITIQKIQYGMNIPDKVFTVKYLETGK